MAQNYECVILLNPTLTDEAVQGYIGQFSKLITDRNGEVVHVQSWGKRRLEYVIGKQREAIYVILYFRVDAAGNLVEDFERLVRITDELLREMTVKVPELRILETPPREGSQMSRPSRYGHAGARPAASAEQPEAGEEAPAGAEVAEEATAPAEETPAEPAPEAAPEVAPEQ
jgi:small subunit ribosomal protein S6